MPGKIISDGDTITFNFEPLQSQGKVLILTPPIPRINGTGIATINKKKVCLSADAEAFTCAFVYTTPTYQTPGSGFIRISRASTAAYVTSPNPQQVLVYSPPFVATVMFGAPATNPQTGARDPAIEPIQITGTFNPQNEFVSAQ
jgi:hypothetical protein